MASAIVSYAPWLAWAFVPPLATKYTLDFLYGARLVARPTSPQLAHAHATRTRILLITAYLIYQFTTSLSASSTEPTAYRLLEVGVESDIETIKRSFRRLAKIHHPDKVGPSGERFFIALRRSHDVLTDSVRRFAYDRFGIAVLDWRGALTVREYMVVGLRESLLFWLVNSAIFAVLSWLNGAGKAASPWSYWHLTLLFSLSSLELYLITTPTRPRLVRRFLPRHTSGDVVAVLRQTYTSTIMAMRQILPLLGEAGGSGGGEIMTLAEANKFIEALAGEMDKLGVGAMTMRRQSDLAVRAELEPFRTAAPASSSSGNNGNGDGALRQRSPLELSYVNHVTRSLIDRSLQASPEVQRAIAERRRMQAATAEEEAAIPVSSPAAAAAEAPSSSPTATAAAQPSLPPHVANETGLPSPPASPRSVASGKSLQPRVSERRSSLGGSSSQSHRRSGGGGGGSRDIRDLANELTGGEGQGQGQGVLGLDVSKEVEMRHGVGAAAGVDHSREVPPYPQSPKLGGGYTMIS